MSNLEADLAKMSERVCGHMNADHADSLLAWAHFYAKVPDAASATMTDVNPVTRFGLELTKADGYVMPKVLIPYRATAGEGGRCAQGRRRDALRGVQRAGLAVQAGERLLHGRRAPAWHHMPPRVKSGLVGAFAVVCAAVMGVLLR